MRRVAIAAFSRELGLEEKEETLLKDMEVWEVAAGTCLMKQDSHKVCCLILDLNFFINSVSF